jgi:hypothetical protein
MNKGTIQVNKLGLMGFTPETQVYYVQNGSGAGSVAVSEFLQKHRKYFQLSLFCGQTYYSLPAARIAKFQAYAESHGFEIVRGVVA